MTDSVEILERYSRETYGLPFVFSNIALETWTFCNRACVFCPVGHAPKPSERMELGLYERILRQLEEIRYRGDIALCWYNEPLADKRLPTMTQLARRSCPESFIYISSNGDFLTVDLFRQLVDAGLSFLNVSQYDGGIEPNVWEVKAWARELPKYGRALTVGVKGQDVLTNRRAGALPQASSLDAPLGARCVRPDEQLIVSATGDVPLCCNDYHVTHSPGNAAEMSLLELWNHPKMIEARTPLRERDRTKVAICRACNEPDTPDAYARALPKGNG